MSSDAIATKLEALPKKAADFTLAPLGLTTNTSLGCMF